MATKFKVGDTVRVLPLQESWEDVEPNIAPEMYGCVGETFTIRRINHDGYVNCGEWLWNDDWLELVNTTRPIEEIRKEGYRL